MLASLPGYVYSVSSEGLWVHLYVDGQATAVLADGHVVTISQRTRYPWDGAVTLEMDRGGTYSVMLRIPAWCEHGARLAVNGKSAGPALLPGTYAQVRRAWQAGDRLTLELPMAVRQMACHPYVANNAGRVALMRGPLVYCVEQADYQQASVADLAVPADAQFEVEWRPHLLGGVCQVRGEGVSSPPGDAWLDHLYLERRQAAERGGERAVPLVAVPYFAWANRAPGAMRVWLRTSVP
jgi:DUF1680 family protein